MNKEFTNQELIDLLEEKAINGKVSLNDIASIVFDTRFPEHLSKNAVEKLIEYSNDYNRYIELAKILSVKMPELVELKKKIIELQNADYINDEEDEKIVNEIYELKIKEEEIEKEIKPLEEEFDNLHEYFKKIQNH